MINQKLCQNLLSAWVPSRLDHCLSLYSNPLGYLAQQVFDYWTDAVQRQILFLDTLRQRGNLHLEQIEQDSPNVLAFDSELLMSGRELLHPVNYDLLRILPPEGVTIDAAKRPFIIFDPRAGHGPGIGGMKEDSEVGLALQAGHPCYFVAFLPNPVPGQTTEDVCRAEGDFVAHVISLHPDAEKPCLIGNCQAGWQITLMAAAQPELVGVLILAGAPLSYWSGVHGKNPMRYVGGLNGGAWTTALACDLGHGIFDGATLVQNFETMNPANTYWKKNYNLYSKIDTEASRFLEFEKWWGAPVLLNREEMLFIVNDLFMGNKLSTGKLKTSGGFRIDIRNIKSPIVVFCSQGDEITPVHQALGWILDLYNDDDQIIANGQTIIYSMHETIGHLGIFVASSVASKEHDKFIHNIDLIETLPPGLYEAVFSEKKADTIHSDLASGNYVLRFERRSLNDLRALGGNDANDDRRFETLSRLSENMLGLYQTLASPVVKSMATEKTAALVRQMNPIRQRFSIFSDRNPLLRFLIPFAETVRKNRRPVPADNTFLALQELISENIVCSLEAYRDWRDHLVESSFLSFYGSPVLQAALGIHTGDDYVPQHASRDVEREQIIHAQLTKLQEQIETGGFAEALIRGIIYVGRGSGAVDEREFEMLRKLRNEGRIFPSMSHAEYKALVRQQYMMLMLDEIRAINSIPRLMNNAEDGADIEAMSIVRTIALIDGHASDEELRRLKKLETLFRPANQGPKRRSTDHV